MRPAERGSGVPAETYAETYNEVRMPTRTGGLGGSLAAAAVVIVGAPRWMDGAPYRELRLG